MYITLWVVAVQYASAQSIIDGKDQSDLSTLLQEVVVTGTGTEHFLKDAPVQTEIITRKSIEGYNARSVDELLSQLSPSLTLHDGDMGSHIQLNGLNNDYILIMIDGKRMNGDVGGQNDLNLLNPANIERIEIVKGAASSLYGSDAIAGVINIITKKNRNKTDITNNVRVGEYGDVRESLSMGLTFGKIKSVTGFNLRHTDGWRNTDLQWNQQQLKSGSTLKTVNRSTNYTVSENLEWRPAKQWLVTADGSYYERWVARSHGPYSYLPNDFYYRNYSAALSARYKLNDMDYIQAQVSYDRYGYFYDYKLREITDYFQDGERITYYPGQRIKQSVQRQVQAQAKGVFHLGQQNVLNVGAEYLYNYLESPHRIDGDDAWIYSLAAYAQDEWSPIGPLTIVAGVRTTQQKVTGFNVSPKISAIYKFTSLNLRASYGLGYKSPTIKELYYNYTASLGGGAMTAYHGNEDLKAQTSQFGSLGLEYAGNKFQISVNGYCNFIRNMIELVPINVTPAEKLDEIEKSKQYQNLTHARIWGVDVTVNYQPVRDVTINAGYSYTDAKAQYANQGVDYMKYLPIDATSKHNATFSSSWQHAWGRHRVGAAVFGRYQSKRYYLSDNNTDGYQTWRLNASYTPLCFRKLTMTVNLGIDNIFNYVDRTPFGRNRATSTPGRTVYASLLVKFKSE